MKIKNTTIFTTIVIKFTFLDSISQAGHQQASISNLPSLKEARKVAIIIAIVIFLGIGYVARFTLTIHELVYQLIVR